MYNPKKMYYKSFELKCLLIFSISLSLLSIMNAQDSTQKNDEKSNLAQVSLQEHVTLPQRKKNIYFFVKEAPNDSYGFNIYIDGVAVMDQSTIPGRPNGKGYRSILSAENVAKYLVDKMKGGEGKIEISDEMMKRLVVD
jgi:Domain of unknown function (DUF4907)